MDARQMRVMERGVFHFQELARSMITTLVKSDPEHASTVGVIAKPSSAPGEYRTPAGMEIQTRLDHVDEVRKAGGERREGEGKILAQLRMPAPKGTVPLGRSQGVFVVDVPSPVGEGPLAIPAW